MCAKDNGTYSKIFKQQALDNYIYANSSEMAPIFTTAPGPPMSLMRPCSARLQGKRSYQRLLPVRWQCSLDLLLPSILETDADESLHLDAGYDVQAAHLVVRSLNCKANFRFVHLQLVQLPVLEFGEVLIRGYSFCTVHLSDKGKLHTADLMVAAQKIREQHLRAVKLREHT